MSDDTTWFWQIVDARGLADVSSDEFVALNELISKAERVEALEMAARAIEQWWQEDGRYHFNGCPNAIRAIMAVLSGQSVLEDCKARLADANSKSPIQAREE